MERDFNWREQYDWEEGVACRNVLVNRLGFRVRFGKRGFESYRWTKYRAIYFHPPVIGRRALRSNDFATEIVGVREHGERVKIEGKVFNVPIIYHREISLDSYNNKT